MTPLGYMRKVESFSIYIRENQDTDDGLDQKKMDALCIGIDQAWKDLSRDDKLVVYNMVKFIHDNIQPAVKKEPDAPRIQLLN